MPTFINVEKTIKNILSVENVRFKLFKRDIVKNDAMLVTPTNDNFERTVIIINQQTISVAQQSLNEEGKLDLVFQPISAEILKQIMFVKI